MKSEADAAGIPPGKSDVTDIVAGTELTRLIRDGRGEDEIASALGLSTQDDWDRMSLNLHAAMNRKFGVEKEETRPDPPKSPLDSSYMDGAEFVHTGLAILVGSATDDKGTASVGWPESVVVTGNLDIRGSEIRTIPCVLEVQGGFQMDDACHIRLPEYLYVNGDAEIMDADGAAMPAFLHVKNK